MLIILKLVMVTIVILKNELYVQEIKQFNKIFGQLTCLLFREENPF